MRFFVANAPQNDKLFSSSVIKSRENQMPENGDGRWPSPTGCCVILTKMKPEEESVIRTVIPNGCEGSHTK